MVIKREVAYGIVRGLTEFWKCDELHDFTVTLGTVRFGCHRLLLAACSEFFRGLFRSGMQEMEQKSVTIKDISCETFELILETIYTGHGILTNDNVIDIWRAAHQLQIHFLVSECENFVQETLSVENFLDYFYISKALNSDDVLKTVWTFMLKNFASFFQTNYFLELPMTDVLSLIKSQDLKIDSEDDVIHAILKWVEFQENHIQIQFSAVTGDGISNLDQIDQNEIENDEPYRKKCKTSQDISTVGSNRNVLTDERNNQGDVINKDDSCKSLTILLSHARTFLASDRCLEMLTMHPLVVDNKEARNIVTEALLYKLQVGKRNGHWPTRAVHRNGSDFLHCVACTVKTKKTLSISAYSLARKEWAFSTSLGDVSKIELAVVDNDLYVLYTRTNDSHLEVDRSTSSPPKELFLLGSKECNFLKRIKTSLMFSDNFYVAVVDSFIYIFSEDDKTVCQFNPVTKELTPKSSLSGHRAISYVMSYEQSILVFYAFTGEGVDETVVRCYDTSENKWNLLKNLEGPANGMASFKDDHSTYLLQSNGALWKVVKPPSKIIHFELVVELWNPDWKLRGAVTFLDALHIFGVEHENLQNNPQFLRSLPGVFREIIYHELLSVDNSMVKPILMKKEDFVKCLPPESAVSTIHKNL